jgi:hypothetical protein
MCRVKPILVSIPIPSRIRMNWRARLPDAAMVSIVESTIVSISASNTYKDIFKGIDILFDRLHPLVFLLRAELLFLKL